MFRAYYIWPDFPSLSLSGRACSLQCLHCGGFYLEDMQEAASPEALISLCGSLKSHGARGVLLSGGCDTRGRMLNLERMLPAISRVHDMGLIIKLHTGLLDRKFARRIAQAGVHIASMEMVGHEETVRHIFGIDATPGDYINTFLELRNAGVPHICPHVCVGLHDGELKGEFRALELLAEHIDVSTLAIIVLRPTRGTGLEHVPPPAGSDVEAVVAHARALFPETKIILGALRPRGSEGKGGKARRVEIEMGALRGGIDGAEVPSQEMLDAVISGGRKVKRIQAFGVLPIEYERMVRAE